MSTIQQLQAVGETLGLNLPLPTPINFAQQQVSRIAESQSSVTRHKETSQANGTESGAQAVAAPPSTASAPVGQSQQQVQLQQQQQIQQQQMQQQYQMQQQLIQTPTAQQTAQTVQTTGQTAQSQPAVAHPAAFQLFHQGALLTQSQGGKQSLIPTIMVPSVATQGQEQQTTAQQFAFTTDPSSFLRQLQVAQLQQQFNAVQQGRPITQQVVAPASQVQQNMQQIQYAGQVAGVAAAVANPQPSSVQPAKRPRAPGQKKPPATRPPPRVPTVTSKATIVSASDTDGELSSRVSSKTSKKASVSALDLAAARKQAEIDTSNMTPADKAKANRDRNREHARNTRLRKKAYLEKLKSTVDELCRERDTLVTERAGAANILVEMHNTRTEVLMSFFALRSANEKRRELWSSILDESCFACVTPVTPYRSFPASEVQVSKCQRTVLGIDGMMSDTASLHVLLNSLVDRSRYPSATIVFRYTLVTEEAVVAGNQMMARWVMSTMNATQCGARMEVSKQGMLCCKFNSAHKIIGLELMFDVMALMLQLKQAAGSDTFSVIPNTVQTCQRSFDKPMVMTLAEEPYTIVQVNKLWEEMTGYKAEEVVGKASCRILEGEETEQGAVEGLMDEIRFKRPASAMIVHYKKSGERFRNFFLAYPLSTDSRITHYLSLSNHTDAIVNMPKSLSVGGHQAKDVSVEPTSIAKTPPATATTHAVQPPLPSQPGFYGTVPSLPGQIQPNLAVGAQQVYSLAPVVPVLSNPVVAPPHQTPMTQTPASSSQPVQESTSKGIKRQACTDESLQVTKKAKGEEAIVESK